MSKKLSNTYSPSECYPQVEVLNSPPSEGCPQGGVVRNTKKYKSLPYNPNLKERARELRQAGNLSEVLLWQQIKNKQLNGLDFDRQKIIGSYIVDFYCANCNLVVEIDGSSHDNKAEYDEERDAYLNGLGLTVIHILDADVKQNLAGVMEMLCGHMGLT
jgi:very-short-patch-repair endonuclease